eukprot:31169-Pelagococcus_subviridis.AAC.2
MGEKLLFERTKISRTTVFRPRHRQDNLRHDARRRRSSARAVSRRARAAAMASIALGGGIASAGARTRACVARGVSRRPRVVHPRWELRKRVTSAPATRATGPSARAGRTRRTRQSADRGRSRRDAVPKTTETTPATTTSTSGTPPSMDLVDDAKPTISTSTNENEKNDDPDSTRNAAAVAGVLPLLAFGGLVAAGAHYKDEITTFLYAFSDVVEGFGPVKGPMAFMGIYVALEILAVPAIPLTMSAGAIFGPAQGTAMVSVSATAAATISFLIARYALREKVTELARKYPKFAAVDDAIGEDSFKVVALLRLSPLLPFALSNYLYGLTSVKTKPYVLASWLGMLPGTFAYVSAGAVGRTLIEAGESAASGGGAGGEWTHAAQVLCGFGFAVLSGGYVTRLATEALKEVEDEMERVEREAAKGE